MNGALKASIRALPERTIYAVTGCVALLGATIAVIVVDRVGLGAIINDALVPFAVALIVWLVLGLARIRIVGFLPTGTEEPIPASLQPWIRSWLLVRFGLLGSALLLIIGAVVTAVVHGPLGSFVQAFACVVWFRILLDLIFGATFNAGVLYGRR